MKLLSRESCVQCDKLNFNWYIQVIHNTCDFSIYCFVYCLLINKYIYHKTIFILVSWFSLVFYYFVIFWGFKSNHTWIIYMCIFKTLHINTFTWENASLGWPKWCSRITMGATNVIYILCMRPAMMQIKYLTVPLLPLVCGYPSYSKMSACIIGQDNDNTNIVYILYHLMWRCITTLSFTYLQIPCISFPASLTILLCFWYRTLNIFFKKLSHTLSTSDPLL